MDYIWINGLNKKIANRVVLNNINLSIAKNTICGFVGANGSGKTMLFRTICGMITPDNGEVRINGRVIGRDVSFPESVGLMIENTALWLQYTGYENLSILASFQKKIGKMEICQSIRAVGLDPDDRRIFKKYSLGMKQRLLLAQAIMEKPDLLVLDEPTSALDRDGVQLFRSLILQEKERGATILISSHNSEDIKTLCNVVYELKDGEITHVYRGEAI